CFSSSLSSASMSFSFAFSFFFHCYCLHLYLLSFPTRRSSDLFPYRDYSFLREPVHLFNYRNEDVCNDYTTWWCSISYRMDFIGRSEEHTSELQSRFDIVCRLLLEKKKICTGSELTGVHNEYSY